MEVRSVAPFYRWSIAFAIDITTCSLFSPFQQQPEHWPKALGRRNTFKAISLWSHVCSGLQLALTLSWQVQKVKTLLDSLFLRGINLLLKDLSSGNCEVGESLYLNQNWSFRVHTVTWSFIYILCTFHQGEERMHVGPLPHRMWCGQATISLDSVIETPLCNSCEYFF